MVVPVIVALLRLTALRHHLFTAPIQPLAAHVPLFHHTLHSSDRHRAVHEGAASVGESGDSLEVVVKIGKWYGRRGFLLGDCLLRFLCQRWFKFYGKRKAVLIDYTEARPDVPH